MTKVSDQPGCIGCPMARLFPDNAFVPPKMGTGLRIVVAEAPGEQEALEGEPLVGGSGKRFDALCRAAGVSRSTLTIANTLSCRPPNNVYPTDNDARSYISESEAAESVAQCYREHLKPLLHSRPWQRIDILGDKSLRALTGSTRGIFSARGSVFAIPELGDRLIGLPTLHPAYVARDQVYSKVVVSDLSKGLQQAPEHYNLYPSLADVEAFDATTFSIDIETDRATQEIRMVGLSDKPYYAICVPFAGAYRKEIKRILLNAEKIIGQNLIQFDLPILCRALEIEYT